MYDTLGLTALPASWPFSEETVIFPFFFIKQSRVAEVRRVSGTLFIVLFVKYNHARSFHDKKNTLLITWEAFFLPYSTYRISFFSVA